MPKRSGWSYNYAPLRTQEIGIKNLQAVERIRVATRYSFIPHKYRPPQSPEAPAYLADKAQHQGSGESSNRVTHRDGMPSHVSPDSNGCSRNVFSSHGRPGFGVPSNAIARWFAPVYGVEMEIAVIYKHPGNDG